MPSRHKAPYCWDKNTYSQDDISKIIDNQIKRAERDHKATEFGIKCPGCGLMIESSDVTDCIQLQDLVVLVRAGGSKLDPGLWG